MSSYLFSWFWNPVASPAEGFGNSVLRQLEEHFDREGLKKSSERHDFDLMDKRQFMDTVSSLYEECDIAVGRKNKIDVVRRIMDCILANRYFLVPHEAFRDAVKKKLIDFAVEENLFFAVHYREIFGADLYSAVDKRRCFNRIRISSAED